MSQTVSDIARKIGVTKENSVVVKQRIRDSIKRLEIKTEKSGNKMIISDDDAFRIVQDLSKKNEERTKSREDVLKIAKHQELDNLALKRKIQELEQENQRLSQKSSKKGQEIARLNQKIEGYADDFKELLAKEQEVTARSQRLESEAYKKKAELEQAHKQLKDNEVIIKDAEFKRKDLEDQRDLLQADVDKMKNASFWKRLFGKW